MFICLCLSIADVSGADVATKKVVTCSDDDNNNVHRLSCGTTPFKSLFEAMKHCATKLIMGCLYATNLHC